MMLQYNVQYRFTEYRTGCCSPVIGDICPGDVPDVELHVDLVSGVHCDDLVLVICKSLTIIFIIIIIIIIILVLLQDEDKRKVSHMLPISNIWESWSF